MIAESQMKGNEAFNIGSTEGSGSSSDVDAGSLEQEDNQAAAEEDQDDSGSNIQEAPKKEKKSVRYFKTPVARQRKLKFQE